MTTVLMLQDIESVGGCEGIFYRPRLYRRTPIPLCKRIPQNLAIV